MLFGLLSFGQKFNAATDIPDLSGKVIIVTGGNIGLGYYTIKALAQHNPAAIYLLARNETKAQEAISSIQKSLPNCSPIHHILCDLSSLPSVQSAARTFTQRETRLDLLMLNAGVMALPASTTEQGYEMQFGTNHVGHALLTKLLLPTLQRTAEQPASDVRVVSLASLGHALAPAGGILFDTLKTSQENLPKFTRYGQSKLANVLYARELARRYPALTSVSVHPGIVATNLYETFEQNPVMGLGNRLAKRIVYQTPEQGARGQLWAAVTPKGSGSGFVSSGEYYTPIGVAGQGTRLSSDEALAARLWEWTEKELEGYTL